MKDIIIRKAALKDKEEIIALWIIFHGEHQQTVSKNSKGHADVLSHYKKKRDAWKIFASHLGKEIVEKRSIVLVAEHQGKVIGYAIASVKENIPVFKISKLGYISDLYVSSAFRNRGISSRFMEEIIMFFKAKKITTLEIAVSFHNTNAYEIYKKWGFLEHHVQLRRNL